MSRYFKTVLGIIQDQIVDKLKLLNYERDFCKPKYGFHIAECGSDSDLYAIKTLCVGAISSSCQGHIFAYQHR